MAGFAALAKIVIDADSAAKELNRTLLDSGMAGADLVDKYGRVRSVMDDITGYFDKAIELNYEWGTTTKDHLQILGHYQEAGISGLVSGAGC